MRLYWTRPRSTHRSTTCRTAERVSPVGETFLPPLPGLWLKSSCTWSSRAAYCSPIRGNTLQSRGLISLFALSRRALLFLRVRFFFGGAPGGCSWPVGSSSIAMRSIANALYLCGNARFHNMCMNRKEQVIVSCWKVLSAGQKDGNEERFFDYLRIYSSSNQSSLRYLILSWLVAHSWQRQGNASKQNTLKAL